jgi:hypothetical protein
MAFRSDFKAARTWDPDTGWELFETPVGPGYPSFILRHPNQPPIEFWGAILSTENIEGTTPSGQPLRRTVFEVRAVNERPGSQATEMERRLIDDALFAFGALHNGPIGPVDVLYAD